MVLCFRMSNLARARELCQRWQPCMWATDRASGGQRSLPALELALFYDALDLAAL
jgi:oligoribonuclease (3'-5' exoribonuclease)